MLLLAALLSTLPCHAGFSVVGSLVRQDSVAPGERAEGTLLVRNDGDTPQRVVVYQRDFTFQADGSNTYDEPGTNPRSNSAWVLFTPSQLELEPGESEMVHYRVEVPADLAGRGTYWSMLMVEPATPEPVALPARGRNVSIQAVVRYGVQIVTNVGEAGAESLAFERGALLADTGRSRLSIDIRNDGESLLSPRVWVELYDDLGRKAGRAEAHQQPGLFPGCSARYQLDLEGLAPGTYTALAVADAGETAVFGTEYTLDLR